MIYLKKQPSMPTSILRFGDGVALIAVRSRCAKNEYTSHIVVDEKLHGIRSLRRSTG